MPSGDDQVVLLGMKASNFATRVRVALEEKGIQYEQRHEDLANKSSLLLQMNPVLKKIPVLIHNGKPVCESLIILEYIDQVWPHKSPLLPLEPYQRAQARFWANFIDKKIYPTVRRIWAGANGEDQEDAKKELIAIFKTLEEQLGDMPYFGGDVFGFVDVALVPFYGWFYVYETCGNFKIEPQCPKLVAWGERCMLKDSVAKSLADPKEIYDLVLDFRRKMGIE